MLKIECSLVFAAVVLALTFPSLGSRFFAAAERHFQNLAGRRGWAVLLVGLTPLGLRAALLPLFPIPEPIVHDEFGYLLAADTYAHGRLSNPSHPLWLHFETFSILQKPTYQCFAQPAQGMILAAGKVLAGHPFWGVWFIAGVMCAAICWMLQGWMPPGWAMLGAMLAILRYGAVSYWADSYWGGAVAAIGGALVLGALPRILRSPHARHALAMGAGLAILAGSRPYEGFAFSLPVAAALLVWILKKHRPPLKVVIRRVALPLAGVLALTACALVYYNWRVTGHPLRMPYQVELDTYTVAPYMIWQKPKAAPDYHHAAIREMYVNRLPQMYNLSRTPVGLLFKAIRLWVYFLGPALTLPLLLVMMALPRDFSWRQISPQTRFLLLACLTFHAALALETFCEPHYAAPLTGLILALVLLAMRRLQLWRWGRKRVGVFLARAIPVICLITFTLRLAARPLHITLSDSYVAAWCQSGPRSFGRAAVLAQLEPLPGRQLVIVRYQPHHEPFEEWVYNEADIDASQIVWAHDMGPQNEELIKYFKGRTVWLLQADDKPPRLSPYSMAQPTSDAAAQATNVSRE